MNRLEYDILLSIYKNGYMNQRNLSAVSGLSLGAINKIVNHLIENGYLDINKSLTDESLSLLQERKPKNAIILAAGTGMRMVPINSITPKALIEVRNECLIERIIKQLKEVGINDITVVVGFLKERFEYLIDEYGVKLVVNEEYSTKNNLHSLGLVLNRIGNTYIIPSDIWSLDNPFNDNELYSWYMVTDENDNKSDIRINRKMEVVRVQKDEPGNKIIGISYITKDSLKQMIAAVTAYIHDQKYDDAFWEEALFNDDRMIVFGKVKSGKTITEINTLEELRELDSNSNRLHSDAIETISNNLHCLPGEIKDITILKKGMTNRSFMFNVRDNRYIMRIPGEGTDQLINRKEEKEVYDAISGLGLCDDPVYIDSTNGHKITRYIENVRCCDPFDVNDLRRCMKKLKEFHHMKLKVAHTFDIFGKIDYYESLWQGKPSIYRDYEKTKANVLSLADYVEENRLEYQLTHIDAVPDNFLFDPAAKGDLSIQLTDWEYAGMQDPHVDIAMFAIYSLYEKEDVDRLIDIYFEEEGGCSKAIRAKIYCYVAMCGLLWSNWCEYKRQLGVEFGEYSIRQYRYAKDYYRYATELMKEGETI